MIGFQENCPNIFRRKNEENRCKSINPLRLLSQAGGLIWILSWRSTWGLSKINMKLSFSLHLRAAFRCILTNSIPLQVYLWVRFEFSRHCKMRPLHLKGMQGDRVIDFNKGSKTATLPHDWCGLVSPICNKIMAVSTKFYKCEQNRLKTNIPTRNSLRMDTRPRGLLNLMI